MSYYVQNGPEFGPVCMSASTVQAAPALFSLAEAVKLLGGISIWTLRKHLQRGNLRAVHIGRRVFLSSEVIAEIQHGGLPSLTTD